MKTLENGLISIKLDSIKDSVTRGGLFGMSEKDIDILDEFKSKDLEKIFLEREIIKLYKK